MNPEEPEQNKNDENLSADSTKDLNEPFGKDKRILIIEDDAVTIELLRNILEKHQFEVQVAKNGKDAWDKIRPESLPHLIISDFLMPQMDGFQFLKGLKKHETIKNVPIVFLSARKNIEDSFLVSGADAFFSKPLDTENFLETVKKLSFRKIKVEDTPPAS